jgi:hypothetical protein
MIPKYRLLVIGLTLLLLVSVTVGSIVWRTNPSAAFYMPSYANNWHVTGGGGQVAASAHYVINGTAGQSSASPPNAASASYIISGGYWYGDIACCWGFVPIVTK